MDKFKICGNEKIEKKEYLEPRVTTYYCNRCNTVRTKHHLIKTKIFLEYLKTFAFLATISVFVMYLITDQVRLFHVFIAPIMYIITAVVLIAFHLIKKEED